MMTDDDDGDERRRNSLTIGELERQGQKEVAWLNKRLAGKNVDKQLGCNALIDLMTRAFHKRLRAVWAPTSLFKLGAESKRLHAEEAALGMPPAHVELSGTKLEQLRAAAIEAANLVIESQGRDIVAAARQRTASKFSSDSPDIDGAAALVQWSSARCVGDEEMNGGLRAALMADESALKLGRFPVLVNAIADAIVTVLFRRVDSAGTIMEAIRRAAEGLPSAAWVESCAEARKRLHAQMATVDPAKAHIARTCSDGKASADEILREAASTCSIRPSLRSRVCRAAGRAALSTARLPFAWSHPRRRACARCGGICRCPRVGCGR